MMQEETRSSLLVHVCPFFAFAKAERDSQKSGLFPCPSCRLLEWPLWKHGKRSARFTRVLSCTCRPRIFPGFARNDYLQKAIGWFGVLGGGGVFGWVREMKERGEWLTRRVGQAGKPVRLLEIVVGRDERAIVDLRRRGDDCIGHLQLLRPAERDHGVRERGVVRRD